MRVIDVEQGSSAWLAARQGRITASRIKDAMNYLKKGGESQKRADYRMDLIAERLTGLTTETFVTGAMQWGIDNEPFARAEYELLTDRIVDAVGFIVHPRLDCSGASPDGLVGDDGGVEIKCPNTTTHLEWMLAGVVPEEHTAQMMWCMACSGRNWWDFVSFDPRIKEPGLQVFISRLLSQRKHVF